MPRCEAIMFLPKLSPISCWEERMGHKEVQKYHYWCKHRSCSGWWKGAFWNEIKLISEEIKSVVAAILELCLLEGRHKSISQSITSQLFNCYFKICNKPTSMHPYPVNKLMGTFIFCFQVTMIILFTAWSIVKNVVYSVTLLHLIS